MKTGLLTAVFVLGLIVGAAITAPRAQDYLIVSGLAKHLDGQVHCNSTTSGLGYEHTKSGYWATQVGFFRNSNCRWSTYAAESWSPLRLGTIKLGMLAGLVTGYGYPVLPAGGFVASYESHGFGLNLIFIPPVGSSGNVLWLQSKVEF